MSQPRSAVPALAMVVVVCLDAVGTVSISEFLSDADPLAFGASMTVGVAAAVVLYLAAVQPGMLRLGTLRALMAMHRGAGSESRALRRHLLLGSLARLDWPLFALAASLMAPAIASVIFLGLWPIMFILLLHRLTRAAGNGQYRSMRAGDYGIMLVGTVGLALVVLSHEGESGAEAAAQGWSVAAGAALALIAVSLGALGAFHYSWGRRAAALLPGAEGTAAFEGAPQDALAAHLTMLSFLAANLAALPVLSALGVVSVSLGSAPGSAEMLTACAIGAVIVAPEGVLTRLANLRTTSLTINAISYLSPVAAVTLFVAAGRAVGVDAGLLTVGTSGIVSVNLMLNFDPEAPLAASAQEASAGAETAQRRRGFKALVIALWASGAVIYFREELLGFVAVETAEWANSEYWGAVALSATVFILMLSFRQQRLAERVRHEQSTAISLLRRVERLHRRGVLPDGAALRDALAAAGPQHKPESWDGYLELRRTLAQAADRTGDGEHSDELGAAEAELDSLVHSKQGGREFAELVALVLFGLTTVAMVLLARPQVHGWSAVLADVFGAVFVAGVSFLYVALLDSMHARDAAVFETDNRQHGAEPCTLPAASGYVVRRRSGSRSAQRIVSLVIGAALLAVYCLLFWSKWVPVG